MDWNVTGIEDFVLLVYFRIPCQNPPVKFYKSDRFCASGCNCGHLCSVHSQTFDLLTTQRTINNYAVFDYIIVLLIFLMQLNNFRISV